MSPKTILPPIVAHLCFNQSRILSLDQPGLHDHPDHRDHPDHPDHLDLHDQPNQVSYNPDHQKIFQEDRYRICIAYFVLFQIILIYLCPGIIVNHIVGTTLRRRLCYFFGLAVLIFCPRMRKPCFFAFCCENWHILWVNM